MEKESTHDEMHELGIQHAHTGEHVHTKEQGHLHTHTHKETKAVLNRMSKIIGHMEAVKQWWKTAGIAVRY